MNLKNISKEKIKGLKGFGTNLTLQRADPVPPQTLILKAALCLRPKRTLG